MCPRFGILSINQRYIPAQYQRFWSSDYVVHNFPCKIRKCARIFYVSSSSNAGLSIRNRTCTQLSPIFFVSEQDFRGGFKSHPQHALKALSLCACADADVKISPGGAKRQYWQQTIRLSTIGTSEEQFSVILSSSSR